MNNIKHYYIVIFYRQYNMKDILENLNGVLLMILILMALSIFGFIKSKTLTNWYKKFGLSAIMMDIVIFMLCLSISYWVYPYLFSKFVLVQFIIVAVIVQFIHDLLLTWTAFSTPSGKFLLLDATKDYIREHGILVYIADSMVITFAILFAQFMKKYSFDMNVMTLLIFLYKVPMLINSF